MRAHRDLRGSRAATVGTAPPHAGERVLLVCSSGGHLAQLHALRPWWRDRDRRWVTFETADARSLLVGEDVAWAYWPTTRNARNCVRNLGLAMRVVGSFRPDLVVSNGAGVAFPFFVAAYLRGIPTVYVEVYDRIDSRTLTGRLCHPITDLFLVQWPEQRALYRKAQLVGPLL